jgi:hypothetical protein
MKCGYCENYALHVGTNKGTCQKKQGMFIEITEERDCKLAKLAPIDSVKWRREMVKNAKAGKKD